ncbi:MAG: hypothetical protein JNL34_11155 [Anaerolineae bacterium]|nr:hypothetical protein [Anaerolineae bacterium]
MMPVGASAAPPEQIVQLFQYTAFLAENGGWLTTVMIAVLAAGGIFCLLSIVDWGRQRWGLVFPLLMLNCGIILAVLSFALYDAFGALQELNFLWRMLPVDPAEAALLAAGMNAISSVGAWVLAGLTGALLYCTLGGTALIRRWRAARAKNRPPAEHFEWQD